MGKDSGLLIALVCDRTFQSITLLQISSSFHHQKRGRVKLMCELTGRPSLEVLNQFTFNLPYAFQTIFWCSHPLPPFIAMGNVT